MHCPEHPQKIFHKLIMHFLFHVIFNNIQIAQKISNVRLLFIINNLKRYAIMNPNFSLLRVLLSRVNILIKISKMG